MNVIQTKADYVNVQAAYGDVSKAYESAKAAYALQEQEHQKIVAELAFSLKVSADRLETLRQRRNSLKFALNEYRMRRQ